MTPDPQKPTRLRTLFSSLIVLLFTGTLLTTALYLYLPKTIGNVDLAEYWAAAQLFLVGKNPYDPELIFQLQKPHLPFSEAIRMWNPPVIFPFIFWFGWFDFDLMVALWFALSLSIIVFVFVLLVDSTSKNRSFRRVSWIFLLTFYPMVDLLSWGQISSLLLLSLSLYILFDRSADSTRQFFAGAALSVSLIKPHVLYLVLLYLVVRSLRQHRHIPLFGFFSGAAVLLILPVFFQPEILNWYLGAMQSPPIHFRTPTLGSWLQGITGIHTPFIRIAPTIVLALVFLGGFLRYPRVLLSKNALYAIVPVSLFSSPYGWGYDQVLLLPTALYLIHCGLQAGGKWAILLVGIPLCANILLFLTPTELGQEYVIWYPMVLAAGAALTLKISEKNSCVPLPE